MAAQKQYKVKIGGYQMAAAGIAAALGLLFLGLIIFCGVAAVISAIMMLLFAVLHAEVAVDIPAFGYWACFWLTIALSFVASFFRGNK